MPKKQQSSDRLVEVVATSFTFLRDPVVPMPGAVGYVVPARHSATLNDLAAGVLVEIAVEVAEDVRVLAASVQSKEAITPTELGRLPWGRYVDAALSHVMLRAERVPETNTMRISPIADRGAGAEVIGRARAQRRNAGRRRVTPERLRKVAELYREALERKAAGDAVTTSGLIAASENVSLGTARSLVARARAEGFLGAAPANRQAGEITE